MNERAFRSRIVDTFQGYIGTRETGVENSGTLVDEFLRFAGIDYPAEWCASFFSFAMLRAAPGMLDPEYTVIKIREQYQEAGAFFTSGNVQRGDAIFFTRGSEGWQGHIGVVESVDHRNRTITFIDGNGQTPEGERDGVRRREISFDNLAAENVIGFGNTFQLFEHSGTPSPAAQILTSTPSNPSN